VLCASPAGLGRAPATALAYMYWLRGWQLPAALEKLKSVRACSPRIEAIRAATADLLTNSTSMKTVIAFRRRGTAKHVQACFPGAGPGVCADAGCVPVLSRSRTWCVC